jgi:hypothetical protein
VFHDTSTRKATLRASIPKPWATEKSQSEPWVMRELPIDLLASIWATFRTEAMSGFPEGPAADGKSFSPDRREENFSLSGLFRAP